MAADKTSGWDIWWDHVQYDNDQYRVTCFGTLDGESDRRE